MQITPVGVPSRGIAYRGTEPINNLPAVPGGAWRGKNLQAVLETC